MTNHVRQEQALAEAFRFLEDHREAACAMSDRIGDNPELGGEEINTSGEFKRALLDWGFQVEDRLLGLKTAFRGTWGHGPVRIALLAEMDALPEIGHGCGHNLHGTASVFAALALAKALNPSEATITLFGTPAEETQGAKAAMADAGLFDQEDLALMFHCCSKVNFVDYRSMAMDSLEFTFTGQTSHAAAAPWEGRNALNGVNLFFHSLDMLRQHVKPSVRMHGIVTLGGTAPNVVPGEARTHWYFRCPTREELNPLLERVLNCARGCAMATETQVSWRNNETSFDDMMPNPPAEEAMGEVLKDLGFNLSKGPGPSGSTDVGNVSRRCPALQPELAIWDDPVPLHTREFARITKTPRAHQTLIQGAKALAAMAMRVVFQDHLRERMHRAFLDSKGNDRTD
ncbi:amidohydrolase [Thermanaerovibrio velox DSM 12556]|uniref:Peptidase M20 domain-containing protein 2 n=1 Tax=Thermanaerovibrio velox DSM 12556 TaxID=926567 RepID=H0UQQ7_9BACT|nr:M20 family metallopeptidase [Thermanaerovibrio velox]EHM10821.1 amidohydrolase [Thermanaerovibrio velox DSM 12556]